MKNKLKVLLVLGATLLLTGCGSGALKDAYKKMTIGEKKGQISGYTMNLRVFGLYKDSKVMQSIRIENYKNNNFKVTDSSDEEVIYYLIDGKNYKSAKKPVVEADGNDNQIITSIKDKVNNLLGNNSDFIYEETKEEVPHTNTDLYLTSLKKAKKIGEAKEESIGKEKYTTYSYVVKAKEMKKILAETAIKDVDLKEDVPVIAWIDKDGYIYKIEYDIATAIKSEVTLGVTVYFSEIDSVSEHKLEDLGL